MPDPSPKSTLPVRQDAARTLGRVKSIGTFLGDILAAFEKNSLPAAIAQALPWKEVAETAGQALTEAVPVVKFAVKLMEGFTRIDDPRELAQIAAALAYQRAVEQAIHTVDSPSQARKALPQAAADLRALAELPAAEFEQFSYDTVLTHRFTREADAILEQFAGAAGYDARQQAALHRNVHQRIVPNLRLLLSDGRTREKFTPLRDWMSADRGDARAYAALADHAAEQIRRFQDEPLFDTEPFALAHVYVETECGKLTWGQISRSNTGRETSGRQEPPLDPFQEKNGGRHLLLETVLGYLGDPEFADAVVIQGPAGAGKSAFTLKLCEVLQEQGLSPIRIRLRHVGFERHVREELARAADPDYPRGEDLFLNGRIFNEAVHYGKAEICPFVLILDGWDEISIGSVEGFQARLERFLVNVRQEFLRPGSKPLVRVVLTGRPSEALGQSHFLCDETPILTSRPLRSDALEALVFRLADAARSRPVSVEQPSPWAPPDPARFGPVFAHYKRLFTAFQDDDEAEQEPSGTSLEVLGLPLLAYLAIRLLSAWNGPLDALLKNPTTLYRSLTDLTCPYAGRVGDRMPTPQHAHIQGEPLRHLLWRTAEAISISGKESISFDELRLRLDVEADDLEEQARSAAAESRLTSLMISFYFKGGHRNLGCEFLHKSFHEYLFAEAIVEALKEFARRYPDQETPPVSPWRDFPEGSGLHWLSRRLGEMFGPQWLSQEVQSHLIRLVLWETERAASGSQQPGTGTPTEALPFEGWMRIRNALAEVWGWWFQEVPLRPQPDSKYRTSQQWNPPFALELVHHSLPQSLHKGTPPPEPLPVNAIDAHLGAALLNLTTLVHTAVNEQSGASGSGAGAEVSPATARHQTRMNTGREDDVRFCPAGTRPARMRFCLCRLQSTAGRTSPFLLESTVLDDASLDGANLARANLARASLVGASLVGANLEGANLVGAKLFNAFLVGACLGDAFLYDAVLDGTNLDGANLDGAVLGDADLKDANLVGASLVGANLDGTYLGGAVLGGANLGNANLVRTVLDGADLDGAFLDGAVLVNIRYDQHTRWPSGFLPPEESSQPVELD